MIKQEALLNKMHEEMQQLQPVSSTYGTTTPTNVDKDKEEQLWAQQRLVTALKRKVGEHRHGPVLSIVYLRSSLDQTGNTAFATESSLLVSRTFGLDNCQCLALTIEYVFTADDP